MKYLIFYSVPGRKSVSRDTYVRPQTSVSRPNTAVVTQKQTSESAVVSLVIKILKNLLFVLEKTISPQSPDIKDLFYIHESIFLNRSLQFRKESFDQRLPYTDSLRTTWSMTKRTRLRQILPFHRARLQSTARGPPTTMTHTTEGPRSRTGSRSLWVTCLRSSVGS